MKIVIVVVLFTLFTSSACIYPGYLQKSAEAKPLREEDAYPADAEDGYGWEKLYMERMCRHYWEDFGLDTRVVRFHNIYGPLGTYDGGREKSPAAICRKVALAEDSATIEIWGDGRSSGRRRGRNLPSPEVRAPRRPDWCPSAPPRV